MRQAAADVIYNGDGIPIVLEIRCRERECCPRSNEGFHVHLYTLYGVQNGVGVGSYVTEFRRYQRFDNLPVGARVPDGAVTKGLGRY